MHLHTYRDESRARHFDLISDGKTPRSIDLVATITSGVLVVGFRLCPHGLLRIDGAQFKRMGPLKDRPCSAGGRSICSIALMRSAR
jgi:hypothetical protein